MWRAALPEILRGRATHASLLSSLSLSGLPVGTWGGGDYERAGLEALAG